MERSFNPLFAGSNAHQFQVIANHAIERPIQCKRPGAVAAIQVDVPSGVFQRNERETQRLGVRLDEATFAP